MTRPWEPGLQPRQDDQVDEVDERRLKESADVETARWSKAGQLDWWVRERQEWWGRVRGADGRQRWIKAVDLRLKEGSQRRLTGP